MLLGSIQALQTGTYTVTRTTSTTYNAIGVAVPGSSSTFPITAVVQPHGGRKMLPLPEGVRADEVKLLHTATAIRTADANGAADVISIGGENYVAYTVLGPYTLVGQTHYEVYAARRGARA